MSRGLGSLQRRLLDELEKGGASARQLSERLSESYEPVRKALKSLLKRGLIADEGCFVPRERPDAWYRGKWERSYALPGREYWRGREDELARLEEIGRNG